MEVPSSDGDRGVEAGTLPTLLPGGRPVVEQAAVADVADLWGVADLPTTPGRSADESVAAAAAGDLSGLLVGGVDPADLADPALVRRALDAVGFLVSLEVRRSDVTDRADVVLPVAPPVEKPGTFVTWEGRPRPFAQALASRQLSDNRVLDRIATQLGVSLGLGSLAAVHAELDRLGGWDGPRVVAPEVAAAEPPAVPADHAVLATWTPLLDAGRGQDGEPHLAGTARRSTARISAATAAGAGVSDGAAVTVSTARGSITLPVQVTDMPDHLVWLPTTARDCQVRETLAAQAGDVVALSAGTDAANESGEQA